MIDAEFRAFLQANLVRVPDIAERADVAVSTVHTWSQQHDDYPEPIMPGSYGETGTLRGPRAQALWWWPDVQQWMSEHGKPEPQHGGTRMRLSDVQLAEARAMHAAVDPASGARRVLSGRQEMRKPDDLNPASRDRAGNQCARGRPRQRRY
ncbi:MAG TPA: hypothetical protein VFQ44_02260 [Streptosporangiaceae bacterium]|nr:hypothetical protein [Streptosporangiaceae bacterium]